MWKYALLWLPMAIIGILNGILREATYGKMMTPLRSHQLSTFTGILMFGVYIWLVTRIWRARSTRRAVLVGFMWLLMTVAFEFLFGHYVAEHPWSRLLGDYNILKGRLWVLVLLWLTTAPYLFHKLQSRASQRPEASSGDASEPVSEASSGSTTGSTGRRSGGTANE